MSDRRGITLFGFTVAVTINVLREIPRIPIM